MIRLPRAFARAVKRLSTVPFSTQMVFTFSSSISAPSLCSALAIADSSTFLIISAPFFGLNFRMLSALSTDKPRIWSATSRPFWSDSRTPRKIARVSISIPLLLRLLAGGVTLESAGQRKLAELVADHVFGDIHRDVLLAVMHSDGQANEIRQNRRTTRPRLDRALVACRANRLNFFDQVGIDKRALFNGTSHILY